MVDKISVIIPVYNTEKYLEKCIQSVCNQTYQNLEIICVDDGSTDGTVELVASWKDSRIRYVRQENQGAPTARNHGVAHAVGKLIAFQDSDDCWYPNKLEKQMEYWRKHSDYSMIYSAYMLRRQNGESVRVPYAGTWGELEGDIFETLLVNNCIGTPTMLMNKECFLELGGFKREMECLEDWDFALRFAEKYGIGFVDEPLMDAFPLEGGISSHAGNFCLNRCRMIAGNRKQLLERGLFERVVGDLLSRAKEWGVLEQVQAMLMAMLSR